jgi:cell wall-associated NlpC family hydrolase
VDSSRARFPSRVLASLASATICLTAIAVGGGTAVADVGQVATGGIKAEPTLNQTRQEIDQLQKKMVVATEEFNSARVAVADSQNALAKLQPQAQARRAEVAKHQAEVDKLANLVYKQGNLGPMSMVAGSSDASAAIDQLTVLHEIQQDRQAKISKLSKAKKSLEQQEKKTAQEASRQQKQLDTVRAKQSSITKDLEKWKALRATLTGDDLDSSYNSVAYDGQGSGNAARAVKFALDQQGDPYEWGAAGPGSFDCSGLMMAAWRAGGVDLPHSAKQQMGRVKKVSRSNIQPGDLVFYGFPVHHVAMYIGNSKVVHASQAGSPVHVATLDGAAGSPIAAIGRP